VILVPAYNHGSEIEALLRAGIVCRFYDVGESLEPDEEELEALLDTRVRPLYLIHYLGFPQDAAW
jgi:dTDP-4-amino-4,6-dideoxygalactose transaminase